jgi:pimeloyl-ACP methyl ester carboxylesterase
MHPGRGGTKEVFRDRSHHNGSVDQMSTSDEKIETGQMIETGPKIETGTAIRRNWTDRRDGTRRDIHLAYETRGASTATPLLMVMGLGAQMYLWPDDFVDQFVAAGYYVIRFDNRDAGLSSETPGTPPTRASLVKLQMGLSAPQTPYLVADMADDAVAVMDHLGIGSAVVMGASMGGMIAQTMAANSPRRVCALVSVMSTTGNTRVGRADPRFLLKMARLIGRPQAEAIESAVELGRLIAGPRFDEHQYRAMYSRLVERSFRPDAVLWQMAAIASSPDRTPALRSLQIPTLVIHGSLDRLIPISGGRATAAAIAGSRYMVFDDMGHDLPRTRWEEMVTAVGALLPESSTSSGVKAAVSV